MRFLLKFTLTLFGAGVVLMVGMMAAGRQQKQQADWLLFQDDNWDLYRMRSDGSQEVKIPEPSWGGYEILALFPNSPYFVAQSYSYYDETRNLYRISLQGKAQRLTNFAGEELFAGISPDGQWVYFSYEGRLYHVRPNGHDLTTLMDLPDADRLLLWKGQNDDWLNISYMVEDEGYYYYLARIKPEEKLIQALVETPPTMGPLGFIGESPDHQWTYFFDPRGQNGYDWGAYRISYDGQQVEYLPEWPFDAYMWGWSDDGQWVYLVDEVSDTFELFRLHPDGTGLQQLTNGPLNADKISPILSPDGQWIIYGVDNEGYCDLRRFYDCRVDLVRIPVNGGRPQPLTVGLKGTRALGWSDDDKWLYFVSDKLYRLDPDEGELQMLSIHYPSTLQRFFGIVEFPKLGWSPMTLTIIGFGVWAVGLVVGLRRKWTEF